MVRGWTARTAAALPVAVAILTACSAQQPASDTLPAASTASSTSAEALPPLGPTTNPVPREAREPTPEGALAFMEYYIGLSSYIADGSVDPQVLIDLSDGCDLCQQVADSYAEDRAAGFTYEGFDYTFHEYGLPRLEGHTAEIGFVYSQSMYEVVDQQGQDPARTVAATGDLQSGAFMEWRRDRVGWVVTSLTIG